MDVTNNDKRKIHSLTDSNWSETNDREYKKAYFTKLWKCAFKSIKAKEFGECVFWQMYWKWEILFGFVIIIIIIS